MFCPLAAELHSAGFPWHKELLCGAAWCVGWELPEPRCRTARQHGIKYSLTVESHAKTNVTALEQIVIVVVVVIVIIVVVIIVIIIVVIVIGVVIGGVNINIVSRV